MLISLSKKLTFLAMPKAASTSIEKALQPYCDIVFQNNPRVKHIRYRRYNRFIVPYVEKSGFGPLETTCLFREPTDWLFSWYKYRARPAINGKPQSTGGMTFDEFTARYIAEDIVVSDIGRTSRFVAGPEGNPAVNHIFRFENLSTYIAFLEERFEQKLDVEHLNQSLQLDYTLSSERQAQLEQYLAPEYEIYEAARR